MLHQLANTLRPVATTWLVAACLPLPALLLTNPATNVVVACLYLGLASTWLATQILKSSGYPDSRSAWLTKTTSIIAALAVNTLFFIVCGTMISVRSNIPFPLLAALAVIPSVGLVPWMTLRIGEPFKAIVLSAFILMLCKLSACVVARVVYGADFLERGYVGGDWRTAKLMISLTWTLITTISLGSLVHGYWQFDKSASVPQGSLEADHG